MLISNCCSAIPVPIDDYGADTSDIGMCSNCGDHCTYEDDEELYPRAVKADWSELSNNFFQKSEVQSPVK